MPETQSYSGIGRMQQEAMAGIREMQNRVKNRGSDPRFRNWSTEPNVPRSDRTPRKAEPAPEPKATSYHEPTPYSYPQNSYSSPPGPAYQAEPQSYPPPGFGYDPRAQQGPQFYGPQYFGQQYRHPRRSGGILSNLFGGNNQRSHGNQQQPQYRTPQGAENPYQEGQGGPSSHHSPQDAPPPRESGKDTTLLQDILNGIGLDDDRILILGLILILVNDKADTTLILALLYLLL